MDKYVFWAGIVGAFSAISLLIGSVIGVSFKLPKTYIGLFAAFGAGALLSALAIELIAPTDYCVYISNKRNRSIARITSFPSACHWLRFWRCNFCITRSTS